MSLYMTFFYFEGIPKLFVQILFVFFHCFQFCRGKLNWCSFCFQVSWIICEDSGFCIVCQYWFTSSCSCSVLRYSLLFSKIAGFCIVDLFSHRFLYQGSGTPWEATGFGLVCVFWLSIYYLVNYILCYLVIFFFYLGFLFIFCSFMLLIFSCLPYSSLLCFQNILGNTEAS